MKAKVVQYLTVALGCLISSVAINLFFVPHHLLNGGVSGIAMIFYFLMNFPIGLQVFLMNVPLLFAAYKFIGKDFAIATIYGTVMFSFSIDATKFLVPLSPLDDPILAALAGGLLNGVGCGLVFRVNGCAGGTDVVAAIAKKYFSLNVGAVGFAVNFVIMLVAAVLFGLKLAILTLIAMYLGAFVTDRVVEGFNKQKTVFIVSYKSDEIAQLILEEVGRGATILHGEGAYTRQNKQVIFVVVSLIQISKIKLLVHKADPHAFMIVSDVTEVLGRGFTLPGTKHMTPATANLSQPK